MPARILVIEDNAANLDLMTYLLKAFGYEPLVAHDGMEGLAMVSCEMPDLIICDIQLPRLDGYGVARRLKGDAALSALPLVAVTAFAMVGDRDKVLAAGFDGYIGKPIDPATFVGQVEAFLPARQRSTLPGNAASTITTTTTGATVAKRVTLLAVDDVPDNLQLLCSVFEPFGYEVITAHTIHQALDLARQSPPDLILSDLHMPDGHGFEFLQNVKTDPRLSAIPFLFLSATVRNGPEYEQGLALGATKFILRPIEPQALLAEVEACLQGEK